MKVLVDQNDVVRAKGGRLVRMALANKDRWADGLTLTETWVPDNTVLERVDGGWVIADKQPEGWSADRDAVVDRETKLDRAIEALENNDIPDEINMSDAVTYFRYIRVMLLGILREIRG